MKYEVHTSIDYLKRYLDKFFQKEVYTWLKIVKFYWVVLALAIVVLISLFIYLKPLPPRNSVLAIGSDGSSYVGISETYKAYFAHEGIHLDLVPTSGLGEGVQKLHSKKSPVDASFMTAGVYTEKEFPELVSLGSVQFAPLWIFYRGASVKTNDPFEYLSHKKISIGPSGSITNKLYRELYNRNRDNKDQLQGILELAPKEAAKKLQSGEIDALFVIDGIASETVHELAINPTIKIMNFPLADAYLKKFDFLSKLTIPKGSINLKKVLPEEDLTILSTTTALLVEKSTHPAIQWAYLLAAQDAEISTNSFFSPPGYFPRNMDVNFPLSPTAKRFYEGGVPSLFNYFPLWMASALESTWVYLIAFFLLILPIQKLIKNIRAFPTEELLHKSFVNFRELDEAIKNATNKDEILEILAAIEKYEHEVQSSWLFGGNARFFFNQKNALNGLLRDANEKLKSL